MSNLEPDNGQKLIATLELVRDAKSLLKYLTPTA